MTKAESRDGLEYPVSNLEVFEVAISSAAQVLIDRIGQLAGEGVSLQDLEWLSRVSGVAERIIGPLEKLFTAINDAPYEATVVEEALETDDQEAEAVEDLAAITGEASPVETVLEFIPPKIPGALSEREQKIWERITSGGSTTEWFGQKDLDIESIGFSSPSSKNQAFSQFCKRAIAAGLLIDNGKERGGRRYMIASGAPRDLLNWSLSEAANIAEEGSETQEVGVASPESISLTAIDPTQEASGEDEETYDPRFEVTIRGDLFSFTSLEYRIIKALLEGKSGTKEIIAHLNGKDGLEEADPEFYNNEFKPALRKLESLLIGDTPLVKTFFVEEAGGKFLRFKLPAGARIESKRGAETLRFTDTSTYIGEPSSRSKRRGREDTEEPSDNSVIDPLAPKAPKTSPAVIPNATKLKLPDPISAARLSKAGLVDAEGGEIALEPQRKAVLNTLRSGGRLTVADIAKQINPDAGNDATFKSIIADELAELQKLIGSSRLRRKQKPGTQAKWWLEAS